MNQQRSRRFRASKEIAEKVLTIANVRESLQARGAYVPSEKDKGEHFDSNCITPVIFDLLGINFLRLQFSCRSYRARPSCIDCQHASIITSMIGYAMTQDGKIFP